MLVARRLGRLFLLLLPVLVAGQTLPTTTISDTVYRGDGAPAQGTLLISWPEFSAGPERERDTGEHRVHGRLSTLSQTGRTYQQKQASRDTALCSAVRSQETSVWRSLVNMNDQHNSVSLKEHLLVLRAADRERAEQQSAFVELRFELAERALKLAHIETLRRLDLLNHAHEEARLKEASFVGREVYESQTKDNNKWRDEVNSTLSTRQGRSSVTSGVIGTVGGLALSALFGMIMYLARVALGGFSK